MKKILLILCLFIILFINVLPVNAGNNGDGFGEIVIVRLLYRIICIETSPPDLVCLTVAEDAHINIPNYPGPDRFEDLRPGQLVALKLTDDVVTKISVVALVNYDAQD